MLEALETAKVSLRTWRQFVGWCLLGQWETDKNPRGQGLGQSLWDMSPLCFPTIFHSVFILEGNLQVLCFPCSSFLQEVPDPGKSL